MMEYIVRDAVQGCVPRGAICNTVMQPLVEMYPLDHAARCERAHEDPLGDRRADIAFAFPGGRRIVLDVGTTNLVSSTALSKTVTKHLEGVEADKDRTYSGYYREVHPFILSLAGGMTERSWNVLKRLGGAASDAARPA